MPVCRDAEEAGKGREFTDLGDPARNAGLVAFVESLKKESWAGMTLRARELAVDFLVHYLVTRMRLMADRKANPEISQQKITAPLIVVGPPRSGSTLLHTLLSLDPDTMAPEFGSVVLLGRRDLQALSG